VLENLAWSVTVLPVNSSAKPHLQTCFSGLPCRATSVEISRRPSLTLCLHARTYLGTGQLPIVAVHASAVLFEGQK